VLDHSVLRAEQTTEVYLKPRKQEMAMVIKILSNQTSSTPMWRSGRLALLLFSEGGRIDGLKNVAFGLKACLCPGNADVPVGCRRGRRRSQGAIA
jgi:hypothetical protein